MAALIVTDGALAGAVETVVSEIYELIADPADDVMTILFIRFVIPVAMLLDYCLMADPAFLFMLGRAVPTVFPIMIALHMADRAVTIGTVNMLALGIADRAVAVGIKIMFALIVTVSAIPVHVKVVKFSAKLTITQSAYKIMTVLVIFNRNTFQIRMFLVSHAITFTAVL